MPLWHTVAGSNPGLLEFYRLFDYTDDVNLNDKLKEQRQS